MRRSARSSVTLRMPGAYARGYHACVLDPKERFSATAAIYGQYRPSYPAELFDWLERVTGIVPPARIADVGCGTGIATRQLAARGYDVVGVDPNEDMLARARAESPGLLFVKGTSS